jgi:uncharacterized protein (TIGR03083 family)
MSEEEQRFSEALQLPVPPADIRNAVLTDLRTAGDFIQSISPEQWKQPSAVAGWTVGDVVAHLNLAVGLYSRLTDLVVSGRTGSGLLRKVGQLSKNIVPAAAPAFNAINNAIPKMLDRALAPEVIKGQFTAGSRSLREKIDRIGPGDYAKPVYYMGGPWPLSFFLAAADNELAIHLWDMQSRLDPRARLGPEARSVLPSFYWSATSWMLHLPKDAAGTISVILSDPNAALWWQVEDGRATTGRGAPQSPDVTITGDSGIVPLILSGRVSFDDATRSTSLRAQGREDLARQFLGAWRII